MSNEHVAEPMRSILDSFATNIRRQTNPVQDYWEECVSSALEEHGVAASREQIAAIAADVKISHENYGLAFHVPENPLASELDRTKKLLAAEREKVVCPECMGKGSLVSHGPVHSATGPCWKCNGEGYVKS
jgi:hypothetical protein